MTQPFDAAIVGGGFSGLWTAYHLIQSEPTLRIAIFERNQVGSGASGRNGGWASALYPISDTNLLKKVSQESIEGLHSQLEISIDEIGAIAQKLNINIGFAKGGSLTVARNRGQLIRLESEATSPLLSASQTRERIKMRDAVAAVFTPHCAALNPAALVVGLAQFLVERGVEIFENSEAYISKDDLLFVGGRKIATKFVVRATEAYQEGTRNQIPIYSLMIASDPLPSHVLEAIGVENRETFAEATHLVTYAQRTADERLVIGGRGASYSLGSRRKDSNEKRVKDHDRLRSMARSWFPVLKEVNFPYSWGGAVGVTRDWAPYVRSRPAFAEMGGYAGDGVTLSYLCAGATADLILQRESARTSLPFMQWQNPKWEPEPLRWIGVNAGIKLSAWADREENRYQRPSTLMRTFSTILGR